MEPLTTIDVLCEVVRRNSNIRVAQLGFHKDHPGNLDVSLDRLYLAVAVKSEDDFRGRLTAHREMMRQNKYKRWTGWRMGMTDLVHDERGVRLHIPMIDFCAKETRAIARIKQAFKGTLGQAAGGKVLPGYLLLSGESYHYIGTSLLTEDEWHDFMGLCLLCEERGKKTRPSVVDRRWIGHSLRRQFGMLRIFDDGGKPEPRVVLRIE